MAILAAKICGLKDISIYKKIKKLKDVNERLELIKKYPNNIKVFIDHAHTPDALFKTLISLKIFIKKYFISFWCGGDRDKKKTYYGKIANDLCKKSM